MHLKITEMNPTVIKIKLLEKSQPQHHLKRRSHCQGGGSHSFFGQARPGPHHPHSKEFLPYT